MPPLLGMMKYLAAIEYQASYQCTSADEAEGDIASQSMSKLDEENDSEYTENEVNKMAATDCEDSSLSHGFATSRHGDGSEDDLVLESQSSFGEKPLTYSQRWTKFVLRTQVPLHRFLHFVTSRSARNPRRTVVGMTLLSLIIMAIGLSTNFNIDVDEDSLWTPRGSNAAIDQKWIKEESGFKPEPRWFVLLFHFEGENVLGQSQVQRMFDVLDGIRAVEGYDEMCEASDYIDVNGVRTCEINGPPQIWNTSSAFFQSNVTSDQEAIEGLSVRFMSDLFPVVEELFYGYPQRDENDLLTSVTSYSIFIHFPHVDLAEDVEEKALDVVLDYQQKWKDDPESNLYVEVAAERSFPDEFTRAIIADIPLGKMHAGSMLHTDIAEVFCSHIVLNFVFTSVPVVFFLMSSFTCAVFFKRHKVQSRTMLAISAVVGVLLSMCFSYGMLFIFGVPFTSITQMLPFIIFGIGMDDSFIVIGAYTRADPRKSAVERIEESIDLVGVSITMTSLTSALAFAVGCTSTVPAVYWVCLYASPAVLMVYLYQLTFFVGCIVLDQQRIDQQRRDCCVWQTVPASEKEDQEHDEGCEEATQNSSEGSYADEFFLDRFMLPYAEFLLRPWVKVMVLIAFAAFSVLCALSATKLRQDFKFKDVLPSDSYITPFIQGRQDYTARSHLLTYVYFRDVNQSDPVIQEQMTEYIDDLVEMDAITGPPDLFWLRELGLYVDNFTLHEYSFDEQLDSFLSVKIINKVFGDDILLDSEDNIIASRCLIDMGNLNADDIKGQIEALQDQERITNEQPVNEGKARKAFFTYSRAYNIWEFYATSVSQLTSSAVTGVIAVSLVTVFMIPHYTSVFVVFPVMCVLYIDMLGVMQWAGVAINPVSYVALSMSIGLIVDFLMHVLLRYYESEGNRREKVIETLTSIGSSIMLGGITTFLGTVPLMFSTSEIFYIIFVAFMALVLLGVSHGIILLPVILSLVGTEEQVSTKAMRAKDPAPLDDKTPQPEFATDAEGQTQFP
jgi:Niemann-Pick C1 protein